MDFFDQDDKTPLKTSTAPTPRTRHPLFAYILKTIIYIPNFTSSLIHIQIQYILYPIHTKPREQCIARPPPTPPPQEILSSCFPHFSYFSGVLFHGLIHTYLYITLLFSFHLESINT